MNPERIWGRWSDLLQTARVAAPEAGDSGGRVNQPLTGWSAPLPEW
jgi:hypothetical protein